MAARVGVGVSPAQAGIQGLRRGAMEGGVSFRQRCVKFLRRFGIFRGSSATVREAFRCRQRSLSPIGNWLRPPYHRPPGCHDVLFTIGMGLARGKAAARGKGAEGILLFGSDAGEVLVADQLPVGGASLDVVHRSWPTAQHRSEQAAMGLVDATQQAFAHIGRHPDAVSPRPMRIN